jgi:glycerophosphoryl diester phosphodiesterase
MARIIAHRGDRAHAPENTLAAFDLALRKGAESLEMDLQLSADGQVVIFHDSTLEGLTDGRGAVREHHARELTGLHVQADLYAAEADSRIPLLEDVLARVGDRCPLYLELKSAGADNSQLAKAVLDLVPTTSPHTLASFDKELIGICHCAARRTALIAHDGATALRISMQDSSFQIASLQFGTIDESIAKRLHQHQIDIWAWTVNDRRDWWRLEALGVSAICTDDPGAAFAWREDRP